MESNTSTYVAYRPEHDQAKLIIKKRKIIYPKYEHYKACICGGEYFQTGVCYTSHPAQYEYRCNKCGNTLVLKE